MTVEKLKQAVGEIRNCRQDVIDRLVQFAPTDSLLFWGNNDELIKKQEQLRMESETEKMRATLLRER